MAQCVSEFTFTLDLKGKKEKPFIRFRCMRNEHTGNSPHRNWGTTPEEINYELTWDAD